jgi:putative ABC transport system substrate-binding protein
MIDRRILLLSCGALVLPIAAHAQKIEGKVYRVGIIGFTANSTPEDERTWAAFVGRLRELGFAEGRNLVIEQRYAEGRNERYSEFAADMLAMKADVVVVAGGTAARAVMAVSRTLPIVMTAAPDPIRSGLVASLARPGGQLTGISNLADELVPKRLELLKAAIPAALQIAFARCPRCALASGMSAAEVDALLVEQEAAARSLGVKWLPIDINSAQDFEQAANMLRSKRPDALLMGANPVNVGLRNQWLAFAVEQRLPLLAAARGFGAMLSYGPDFAATYAMAAGYVAKILRGAHPGDLPMEQPTKFEFVVNLRIAKALGITIPESVLVRADEVIQ